ncbi:FAD:protein FMN transferase, partial [Candidatus Saccharibacteria bacterium]|nr:FAD:protein FMN transferase [Candidatus Saccharibacteria bacterium]
MQFDAIGTRWVIETTKPLSAQIQRSIYRRVELFDRIYSRFRDDSLVELLTKKPGTYTFPEDSIELVRWYQLLYVASEGALTPLVGDVLNNLGYDKTYSFTVRDVKPVELWEDIMTWHGSTVTIRKPVTLDFGAAGKGYLVDIVGSLLEANGIVEYVIDASGDIRQRGQEMQVVGLEHPDDPTRVIGTATL